MLQKIIESTSNAHDLYWSCCKCLLQFDGHTPSTCWNQVYERIRKLEKVVSEGSVADGVVESGYESGSDMFGFSNPKVAKLIKVCCLIIC